MAESVWIYDHRQGSEYITQRDVTLQVNEYLLRDVRILNPYKDLR